MSKRALPEIKVERPRGDLTSDIPPKALAAWNADVIAAASDGDVITIFEPIGEDFFGEGVTAKSVSGQLRAIGGKPVTVQINSPGGNLFEGIAIHNLLRTHPAEVTVQIVGIAASAASVIAMAGDSIEIARSGMIMIHNSQWVAAGDRHVMIEAAAAMEVFDQAISAAYVDRTGQPDDDISAMMDVTTFLSSARAIELGFADALLPADQTAVRNSGERPPAYRLEAVLAKHGVSRSERRRVMKDFVGTPSAADTAKPGAGDTAVEDDGTTGLSLALARLKLTRA
jgi:ATP-dependent protease ClpP protease subunit